MNDIIYSHGVKSVKKELKEISVIKLKDKQVGVKKNE